MSFSNILCLIE
jgi:WD40 repeat protein